MFRVLRFQFFGKPELNFLRQTRAQKRERVVIIGEFGGEFRQRGGQAFPDCGFGGCRIALQRGLRLVEIHRRAKRRLRRLLPQCLEQQADAVLLRFGKVAPGLRETGVPQCL